MKHVTKESDPNQTSQRVVPASEMKKAEIPVFDPQASAEAYAALQSEHHALIEQHQALQIKLGGLGKMFVQAIADNRAFINQCDREGLGMQTVTDHRKRIEKLFKECEKEGVPI